MKKSEVVWAAGFLEGEGWFGLNGWKAGKTQVLEAYQQNLEPLRRLRRTFGGVIYVQSTKHRGTGGWRWDIGGEGARIAMKALLPHLSRRRRAQIRKALRSGPSGANGGGWFWNGKRMKRNKSRRKK